MVTASASLRKGSSNPSMKNSLGGARPARQTWSLNQELRYPLCCRLEALLQWNAKLVVLGRRWIIRSSPFSVGVLGNLPDGIVCLGIQCFSPDP